MQIFVSVFFSQQNKQHSCVEVMYGTTTHMVKYNFEIYLEGLIQQKIVYPCWNAD